MAILNETDGLFTETFLIKQQSNTTYTLDTTGTYVDKNIKLISDVRSATATLAATGNASITALTYTYDDVNNNFIVNGNQTLSGTATLTISQAGWIGSTTSLNYQTSTDITSNIEGSVNISGVNIPKIGIEAAIGGTLTLQPSIIRMNSVVDNATNVGTYYSTTTTAPSSGYYVAIQSNQVTSQITANPYVNSAGYGTPVAGQYAATTGTAIISTTPSDVTFLPIKAGQGEANFANVSMSIITEDGSNNGTNIYSATQGTTTTEPTSGYYLAFSITGSGSSKITSAGWFQPTTLGVASTTQSQYIKIKSGSVSFNPGSLSPSTGSSYLSNGGYYNGTSFDTTDTIDISRTSQAEGYYQLKTTGYGKVSRTTATCTKTAGYITAGSSSSSARTVTSNSGYSYYYIKKSTLDKTTITPSTTRQVATISAGYYPTVRQITVDAMTTVTPTTNYIENSMAIYFTAGTSTNYNVAIVPRYSNEAGYVSAHTNANNGGTGYWNIKTTQVTQGDSTINGSDVTRGTASWGTGWVTTGSIPPATFANVGTSGVTYLDISDTSAAPVLTSGGYLFINKGYVDNFKISLGALLPDADVITINDSDQLENGETAVDADGNIITGSIQVRTDADLTASGPTVTVPAGYYKQQYTKSIANGAYNAGVTLSSVTVTPSVSITSANDYGFTSVEPSGTNGVAYITVTPGANSPTYYATGIATITTAGYLATGSKQAGDSATVNVAAGTNYYAKIVTPSFSGGVLSGNTTTTITTTGMDNSTTATNYYIDAAATGDCNLSAVTYSNEAGVISANTNTQAIAATARGMNSTASRIYIPEAVGSITLTPGSGSCTYNSTSSVNVVVSDTDTSGIAITFDGSGEVEGLAQVTTAGYTPINNSFASTSAVASRTSSTTKYITGVTLNAPSSGTNAFEITVPNGSLLDFITFRFTVDSSGNVYVDGPDDIIEP